ncbi:hypothetical protein HDC93_001424 [Streptomyces sp. AK010]|nr:hypothetical protein [Streptomyces sp. AK010]
MRPRFPKVLEGQKTWSSIPTARVIAAVCALPLAVALFTGVATADNGAFADNGPIASVTEA